MKRTALDEVAIRNGIGGSYWRVKVIDEVDSTQNLLRNSNPLHGDVITAEYQHQGRGRLDRSFVAPKYSGLLFSAFVSPKISKERWGWIPLIVGISVTDALRGCTGVHSFLTKWPNDVLGNRGKVAGILCEVFPDGLIIGVGINVTTTIEELPVATASSVLLETEKIVDRTNLLSELLLKLEKNLTSWEAGMDFSQLYVESCSTIGKEIEVLKLDGNSHFAKAVGIHREGGLILEDGEIVTVGDIRHIR